MDDWIWVFPKKHYLRQTMKKQYAVLHALRVAMHPAKTFIGKVAKGFDFLGFHLTPTGVSDTALSRHEQKVSRLYEQGASAKRIRGYRKRWLAWGIFCGVVTSTSLHAAVDGGTSCQADFNAKGSVINVPGLILPAEDSWRMGLAYSASGIPTMQLVETADLFSAVGSCSVNSSTGQCSSGIYTGPGNSGNFAVCYTRNSVDLSSLTYASCSSMGSINQADGTHYTIAVSQSDNRACGYQFTPPGPRATKVNFPLPVISSTTSSLK